MIEMMRSEGGEKSLKLPRVSIKAKCQVTDDKVTTLPLPHLDWAVTLCLYDAPMNLRVVQLIKHNLRVPITLHFPASSKCPSTPVYPLSPQSTTPVNALPTAEIMKTDVHPAGGGGPSYLILGFHAWVGPTAGTIHSALTVPRRGSKAVINSGGS